MSYQSTDKQGYVILKLVVRIRFSSCFIQILVSHYNKCGNLGNGAKIRNQEHEGLKYFRVLAI